ncbi:MAG: single-stranded DNA-binding protein, partial [Candidatus Binatus sp.]
MTGNRIELEGRLLDQPELRITPAGTPVLRFTVECGAPGEELRLGIVMTGESVLAAKPLLERGRQVKVIGRMRALKTLRKDAAFDGKAQYWRACWRDAEFGLVEQPAFELNPVPCHLRARRFPRPPLPLF